VLTGTRRLVALVPPSKIVDLLAHSDSH